MSTDVFNYSGVNPNGIPFEISVDLTLPGSGFVMVESGEDSASGYIAQKDIIAMAEHILWVFRDKFDDDKKPESSSEIERTVWDRDV